MIAPMAAEPRSELVPRDAAALFRDEYAPLVRLAVLLVGDRGVAEEVVQDAFVKLHSRWRTIREPEKAAAWLRSAVLNGARSQRRRTVRPIRAPRTTDAPAAEIGALAADLHRRTMDALRKLPERQRAVLVLKFYEGLSEAEIASTLGISTGSVKTHVHRGVGALRSTLGVDDAEGER
jgi:RNA polymerase sigma-70 factor (sigma-E family)